MKLNMVSEEYIRVKSLLEDYYKNLSSLTNGGIELRLKEYSLNGEEILQLINEVTELIDFPNPLKTELNNTKEELKGLAKKLTELSE
jgi:hypothetical protein